jgi:hypothetical protein
MAKMRARRAPFTDARDADGGAQPWQGHAASINLVEDCRSYQSPRKRADMKSWCGSRCPPWVKSGHSVRSRPRPLYPQKRTLELNRVMSALCQKRTCELLRLYVDLLLNNNR